MPLSARNRDLIIAFSETPGRFLCEVPAEREAEFAALMADVAWSFIGEVVAIGPDGGQVEILSTSEKIVTVVSLEQLAKAWRS